MERRDFIKMAALTGLALGVPFGANIRKARAEDDPYTGLFVITVHAGGGWDPTSLCDPKGFSGSTPPDAANQTEMNKAFATSEIDTAGNLRVAPIFGEQTTVNNNAVIAIRQGETGNILRTTGLAPGVARTVSTGVAGDTVSEVGAASFFHKHYSRLLVVNGIDSQTNDHDGGTRHTWSGKLAEGNPTFAALFAGSVAKQKPMAFINAGGYDFTAGTVSAVRANDVNSLLRIAKPNLRDPNNDEQRFVSDETFQRMVRFQRERTQGAIDAARLPRWRNALATLFTVREGNNELNRVSDILSELTLPNDNFQSQVRLGIASYKAGVAASMSLGTGGFDTHQNHDQNQIPALRSLLSRVDYIYEELWRQFVKPGLWSHPLEKALIIIGSDFGRTPGYNQDNGKDHWSTTSMMVMGAGVTGNRVVGASDERHRMLPVDPGTLQPLGANDSNGERITPGHIGLALRQHTGIVESESSVEFPINTVTPLNILA